MPENVALHAVLKAEYYAYYAFLEQQEQKTDRFLFCSLSCGATEPSEENMDKIL